MNPSWVLMLGHYDNVGAINDVVEEANKRLGTQVGIHVDAASGGFVAPFQFNPRPAPWDFRLKNVLSISASGHKFGLSVIGTGWVVWRQREDLAEHVVVKVTYLGGLGENYTLNFSRPAAGTIWKPVLTLKCLFDSLSFSFFFFFFLHSDFSSMVTGVFVQLYKFIRLGKTGYTQGVDNMMAVAAYIRQCLRTFRCKPTGDVKCVSEGEILSCDKKKK